MEDTRPLAMAFFGVCFGIFSFFSGFKKLRRKRMIENIPTSTIRSMAMGLVEIIGKALKDPQLYSPLTSTACVFYKYEVERLESRGKSSRWVTIAHGSSKDCLFYVNDGTGEIAVQPEGAEMLIPVSYRYQNSFGKDIPDNLVSFLEKNKIGYKVLFGLRAQLRFTEWRIAPEDTAYIIGTADKNKNLAVLRKETLLKHIEELKNNPEKMKEVDTDKDGTISEEEWDAAVYNIESALLQKELESAQKNELHDVVIGKGDHDKVFIISNHSKEKLIKMLSWQSALGIFGGVLIMLVSLCYILCRFNMF